MRLLLLLGCILAFSLPMISWGCPPNSQRQKTINMAIFYTDTIYSVWKAAADRKKLTITPEQAIQNVVRKVNTYFSSANLGNGNSVNIVVSMNNIKKVSASNLGTFGYPPAMAAVAAGKFCNYAHQLKRSYGMTWDYAFAFVNKGEISRNVVAQHSGVCAVDDQKNCGVVMKTYSDPNDFMILDKTWAHEIAHTFGVFHDNECKSTNNLGQPCPTLSKYYIMTAPAQPDVNFSHLSKLVIDTRFKDKNEFTCLRWSCGAPQKPYDMLSNPQGRQVLQNICNKRKAGYTFFNKRYTDYEYRTVNFKSPIGKILKVNRYWYKPENICKGIPCQKTSGMRFSSFGIEKDTLTWMRAPCGQGKICQNGLCVRG